MNREFEGESQLINDQLSKAHEVIENQTCEIGIYVKNLKKQLKIFMTQLTS